MNLVLLLFAAIISQRIANASVLVWNPLKLFSRYPSFIQSASSDEVACVLEAFTGESCSTKSDVVDEFIFSDSRNKSGSRAVVAFFAPSDYKHTTAFAQLTGAYSIKEADSLFNLIQSSETVTEISFGTIPDTFAKSRDRFDVVEVDLNYLNDLMWPIQGDKVVFFSVRGDHFENQNLFRFTQDVAKRYSNNYVGLINVADGHRPKSWVALADQTESENGSDPAPSDYITWEILVGLILTALFFGITACFLGLLDGIETPLRFPRQPFDVSKEY
uniref:Uncharacterized protein n=1 Tax=Spongospora subterranea TaxID=70186 RepID=A0A0H5R7I7_9EUKA|eukprot:CRZ10115.1 hypothetical protein [Spongospora subterranea]